MQDKEPARPVEASDVSAQREADQPREPAEPSEQGPKRAADGKFLKGSSGNPAGRPPFHRSFPPKFYAAIEAAWESQGLLALLRAAERTPLGFAQFCSQYSPSPELSDAAAAAEGPGMKVTREIRRAPPEA